MTHSLLRLAWTMSALITRDSWLTELIEDYYYPRAVLAEGRR